MALLRAAATLCFYEQGHDTSWFGIVLNFSRKLVAISGPRSALHDVSTNEMYVLKVSTPNVDLSGSDVAHSFCYSLDVFRCSPAASTNQIYQARFGKVEHVTSLEIN